MRKLTAKLEDLFIMITFAEEREFNVMRETLKKASQKAEDTLSAVAFAEAGEFETAASFLSNDSHGTRNRPSRPVARKGARLCTGGALSR